MVVPRIEVQLGVFVSAVCPALFEQLVNFQSTPFRQWGGLSFKDPWIGLTKATIYPKDDSVLKRICELKPDLDEVDRTPISDELTRVPASVFAEKESVSTYREILHGWYDAEAERLGGLMSNRAAAALERLAAFHARLQHKVVAEALDNVTLRSISRLESAFQRLFFSSDSNGARPLDVGRAIRWGYMNHAEGTAGDDFMAQIVREFGYDPWS